MFFRRQREECYAVHNESYSEMLKQTIKKYLKSNFTQGDSNAKKALILFYDPGSDVRNPQRLL